MQNAVGNCSCHQGPCWSQWDCEDILPIKSDSSCHPRVVKSNRSPMPNHSSFSFLFRLSASRRPCPKSQLVVAISTALRAGLRGTALSQGLNPLLQGMFSGPRARSSRGERGPRRNQGGGAMQPRRTRSVKARLAQRLTKVEGARRNSSEDGAGPLRSPVGQ